MNILLVSATLFEIKPLPVQLLLTDRQNDQLSAYYLNNTEVDILITGVGMVATACFLGRQLALKNYDLAINAGVAGSFDELLTPGTVVNVVEDYFCDLGAEDGDNFRSVFDLGLTDPDSNPYTGGRLINNPFGSGMLYNNDILSRLAEVKALTSNTVHSKADHISRIRSINPADIETMEGAAFFFACLSAGVPCLQLRSISNPVGERDRSSWNLDLAIQNLNKVLWSIITSLPGEN